MGDKKKRTETCGPAPGSFGASPAGKAFNARINPKPEPPPVRFAPNYLTRKDEFPTLRKTDPEMYTRATAAKKKLDNLYASRHIYEKANKHARMVKWKLSEKGKLTAYFTSRASVGQLVESAVIDRMYNDMKGKLEKQLFGPEGKGAKITFADKMNKLNAILTYVSWLKEIKDDVDAKRLAKELKKDTAESFRLKVNFVLKAMAAKKIGNVTSPRYTDYYISLWKKYQVYDRAWRIKKAYLILEQQAAGTYRDEPEKKVWPNRSGNATRY